MIKSKINNGTSFEIRLDGNQDSLSIPMIWISAGSFLMGSENSAASTPFEYTFSKGYWLGKYPITQDQWLFFYQDNPSLFQGNGNYPVGNINREQAIDFCDKLNTICENCLPENYTFTLPGEAHWEYACYMGKNAYVQQPVVSTSSIAISKLEKNDWGLAGMLGGRLEWCYDLGEQYPTKTAVDWIGQRNPEILMTRGGPDGTTRRYRSKRSPTEGVGMRLCLR